MLQWGRALLSADGGVRESGETSPLVLQWGRALLSADGTEEITIARTYVIENGQKCHELVRRSDGSYYIAVEGRCEDARKHLTLTEAREFWDEAGKQIEARP